MLTTTLRKVINYGSACLRVTLGKINFANGIFHIRLRLDCHVTTFLAMTILVGHPHPNENLLRAYLLTACAYLELRVARRRADKCRA